MSDSIVIFSGGLDSTVLMYKLVKERKMNPFAIIFDYGQRHRKEINCALVTCTKLGIDKKVIKLPLNEMFKSSALLDKDKSIPEGHYEDENQKVTVVPNRNMIMLSIAAGFAEDMRIKQVFYGAHANDRAIYPDCRPEFMKAVSAAMTRGTYKEVQLITPFSHMTKAEIVKEGIDLNVPFEDTWSCYNGSDYACGKCGTCVERLEAFNKNKHVDPLDYEGQDGRYYQNKWVNKLQNIAEGKHISIEDVYKHLQDEVKEVHENDTYHSDELVDVMNTTGILYALCGKEINYKELYEKLQKRDKRYGTEES